MVTTNPEDEAEDRMRDEEMRSLLIYGLACALMICGGVTAWAAWMIFNR